jgi:pimeloyl-ACP methyl ester carboxylesterase
MSSARVNGVRLDYEMFGEGQPVVLVCGTGQPAVTWQLHMVAPLVAAGFRVITFDNRGVAPSESTSGPYTVGLLAEDLAALLDHLDLGPAFIAGLSLGAFITQELCLQRPDLVAAGVMMGTLADQPAIGLAWCSAQIELIESGIDLPGSFEAMRTAYTIFSPGRLFDDAFIEPFLELMAAHQPEKGPGAIGQLQADLAYSGRLPDLARISVPTMVMAFEHDLLTPPHLGRAVADAISGCRFVEIPGVGHAGPMEDATPVIEALLDFFGENQ